ncbi:glucose-6-phosphate dehydrogenase [Candidatus Woesearchaeota archaeon]|nr:glucose-6-phosphate dehydrogenase [Candidatus Woesearchaeota archaeon]
MEDEHCIFSIFGATGDLTNRKLLPAFYFMEQERQLKEKFRIVCIARKKKTSEDYRKEAADSIKKFSRVKVSQGILDKLINRIYYHQLDFLDDNDYGKLKDFIGQISGKECSDCERVFYLAAPPQLIGNITKNLKESGLAGKHELGKPFSKVMFEKPFGHNLDSARKLNNAITSVFDEKQVYRIDHYMAKELVQNLLALRFANSIFEPLWNREYIDHIQITVAETLGVGGRGDYYDNAGALRDVVQNHIMQLLALVAMAEPKKLSVEEVRNQKVKALKSISGFNKMGIGKIAVEGQYSGGEASGKKAIAYADEPEVSKSSKTETYFALRLQIDNSLWKNVPFYVRTGKRLKDKATEIVIVYKDVHFGLFSKLAPQRNMMKIRVQPYEGITLQFNAKVPGNKFIIDDVNMDFCHECQFGPNSPEAYERLLYDVLIGDQTLFTRWDEVENAWRVIDPLIEAFKNIKPKLYQAGTWGPKEADELIERDGRKWVEPKRPSYADQLGKSK